MAIPPRLKRFHDVLPADQRDGPKRDLDRILYSSAFQRLVGITQVISPSERRVCHNRLTHSLKVAQVGRRLAEYILTKYSTGQVRNIGGIDPDVVASAGLAHDLGHPPFGHAAETALQECFRQNCPRTGSFEGNAQSFRVVTRLAVRSDRFDGLDLTRATLNAILKYPWCWQGRKKPTKWGAYEEEEEEFLWARRPLPAGSEKEQTVEAEIMDTADDISYAVHDLEDFYRAGMVPLERLIRRHPVPQLSDEGTDFVSGVFTRQRGKLPASEDDLRKVFVDLLASSPVSAPYKGLRSERAALRAFTSSLIGRYIQSAELRIGAAPGERLLLPAIYDQEIFMLQQLTWHYMILNPALSTQQQGQKHLIRELFQYFYDAAMSGDETRLPPKGREMMQRLSLGGRARRTKATCTRLASDMVCCMTEPEAQDVAHRILGISPGSAFDRLL